MEDLTITLTIDSTDQLVLKNDLVDINDWVKEAVNGKANNCWKRLQREWTDKLMNDESYTDPIPSNKDDFVTLVTSRADYKNRAARDAENQPG